jgi:hypothetical protein
MAIIAALHVLLILFVPWTSKWVPVFVIIPIGVADLYIMLAILSVVGKFMEGPRAPEGRTRVQGTTHERRGRGDVPPESVQHRNRI